MNFSGFAKEVAPCSRAKTVSGDHLYSLLSTLCFRGMHDKPCLFSSRYLGYNGCQADYEKLRASKQKTISGWDNILWTLALDCGSSIF